MNILELKNVQREEEQIFYIRKYTAIAVVELPTETVDTPILFSIETGPFGDKKLSVKIIEAPNYPILPIITSLKPYILKNDKEGRLPT